MIRPLFRLLPLVLYGALSAQSPADDSLARALSLARSQRWDEARSVLEQGAQAHPADPRFPVELAGVAFKQQRYSEARRRLHHALGLAPADAYANQFLGSLYQLDNNTEAALKYWNRTAMPRIREIRSEPRPALDPVLFDRAFAMAPASMLTLQDYRATRARLEFLEVFPAFRLDLEPVPDSGFDAVFRALTRPKPLLSLIRGLPFQAITPGFSTRGGANLDALLRWDKQKRRAAAAFSAPLARSATAGYRLFADGRNENWITRGLNLRKFEAGAELRILLGSRWQWTTAAIGSTREYRNLAAPGPLFVDGGLLKYRGSLSGRLWSVPERRLILTGAASLESGRVFSSDGAFTKSAVDLEARWTPAGEYEIAARARAGHVAGDAPFDELFLLGVERDTELALRAHPGTRDGRKGASPLARRFALFNAEADRTIYRGALFTLRAGPFLDSGIGGGEFGSGRWLFDTGAQAKIRILGAGFVLTYGRDLRTGRDAWYASWER